MSKCPSPLHIPQERVAQPQSSGHIIGELIPHIILSFHFDIWCWLPVLSLFDGNISSWMYDFCLVFALSPYLLIHKTKLLSMYHEVLNRESFTFNHLLTKQRSCRGSARDELSAEVPSSALDWGLTALALHWIEDRCPSSVSQSAYFSFLSWDWHTLSAPQRRVLSVVFYRQFIELFEQKVMCLAV